MSYIPKYKMTLDTYFFYFYNCISRETTVERSQNARVSLRTFA